jgi:hypothetical protein
MSLASTLCTFKELFDISVPMMMHGKGAGFAFSVLSEYFAAFGDISLFPRFAECALECVSDSESVSAPVAMTPLARCFDSIACDLSFIQACYRRSAKFTHERIVLKMIRSHA